MKIFRTAAIACVCLLVIFTIIGFLILPPVLVSVASKNLSQALQRQVTIQKIRVNPYTLVMEVQGLTIRDKEQAADFASFASLMVNAQWSSLFRGAPVVREVRLDRPTVRIIRFEDNTYNFSDLLRETPEAGQEKEPLPFSVSNIQISGGTVVVDDRPMGTIHTAERITLTIPFLSNMPHLAEVFVQPAFEAVINRTPISLKGRSKPFSESLESTLTIDLKDIDIPSYVAYVPVKPGFVLETCLADLNATVTFRQFKDGRTPESSVQGLVTLRDLAMNELGGTRIFTLPVLTVAVAPSQILQKRVHIGKIDAAAPELALNRDEAGDLNLARALKATALTGTDPSTPDNEHPAGHPLVILIDEVVLSRGSVSYTDSSGSSPVKITCSDLSIRAQDITTEEKGGGSAEMSCTVNRTGALSLGVSFGLNPLTADLILAVDRFEPAWVQPYVVENVPILIRRGSLSAKGRARLAWREGTPPDLNFTGDVRVADFASVDRAKAEDLLSWKDLSLTGIDLALNPGRLAVTEITLTGPSSTYIVNPDRTSNVATLAGGKERPAPAPEPNTEKKTLERISVGRVSVKNGRFTFIDRSVTPTYTSTLSAVAGTVTGLSTDEFKKAKVDVQARLDNQAPITITGSINPLKTDLFVDLRASLTNMELGPMTPYSGRYAGLAIDKGKLSLDLNYSIDRKELRAENDVLIDQLTFGDSVESKEATRLPVRLAVALLRDSSGRIDLHLPVTGRTDDPEFHVGKVILKVIVNILQKAATTPFALLEAMYPGAAELSHIDFDPGGSTLSGETADKISDLAKILIDRPSLTLEITGFVDSALDREGLANMLFERKLKTQKVKDLMKAGKQAPSVDEVVVDPAEYGTYLARAYRAESFEKPSNALGIPAKLPDEEMQRLIREHISVTEDDLKGLASARARQVRDALAATGQIDPGRIFIVEKDPFMPEQQDKVANSRVNLTIR